MDIKHLVTIYQIMFCGIVFSQSTTSFFISPIVEAQFGTKQGNYFQKNDFNNFEFLPLSRAGEIHFSTINFGLEVGYKRGKQHFGLKYKTSTSQNGYHVTGNIFNTVYSILNNKVTTGAMRADFGFFYAYEKLIPWEFDNRIQFNFLFSRNRSTASGKYTTLLSQSNGSLPSYYISDSTDNYTMEKTGFTLGIDYVIPLTLKSGKNLFDLRLSYYQGFKVVDRLYVHLYNSNNQETKMVSDSRGSYFSISISKNIHFFKNKL